MKKSAFLNLLAGVVGGLLFSIGMCMCLVPEWDAFDTGVIVTAVGGVSLLVQAIVAFVRSGKRVKINWKLAGKVLFGVIGALILGVGMCMVLVWKLMLPGIAVGVIGIVWLLCLIPMCMGLK